MAHSDPEPALGEEDRDDARGYADVRRERVGSVLMLAAALGAAGLGAGWNAWFLPDAASETSTAHRPVAVDEDGYVASETCRACHPSQYETWHASHHRTMTQVVSEDTVIADFDDRRLVHFGREFRFYREGNGFFMEMKAARSPTSGEALPGRTFELVLSTGAHHQQAFWFRTGEGRNLGKLPFIWITSEQRWVPYGSIFVAPPSRPNMQTGLWNKTCIKCHVVRGQPRWEAEPSPDTRVAEFGIACGACHGAAEEHAAIHRNPLHRYREHFSTEDDPTLVNVADLDHQRSSQVCGQCHAVFDFFDAESEAAYDHQGFAYRPGGDLHASRHVFQFGQDRADPVVARNLEKTPQYFERRFWSDGMVRVSGREYNGMLETPCHQRGTMSCLSCHSMHPGTDDRRPRGEWANDQLKPGMRGNPACLQCHEQYEAEAELVRHTHHPASSAGSRCTNCHMPHTTLGLMKAMRSHTVDSPDVATTMATGRPNACNLCHLDKTLAWTADHLSAWYEIPPPALSEEQRSVASSVRWILQGDAGQRAIAAWHYGWEPAQEASGTEWMGIYLAELLTDRYDVVRFIGQQSLKRLPGYADFEYDFVDPEAFRSARRLRAEAKWREGADRPSASEALLIDAEGHLMDDRFRELRGRRLDPPVILAE
ncbi:MAG: multiheme c-type cytochrome [Myxococcota bacterium]